jgi:hypothetical protein
MVYRLGLTPDQAYIESAKISHLVLCDASGEIGPSAQALKGIAQELGSKKIKIIEIPGAIPNMHFEAGIYEDYIQTEAAQYRELQQSYSENSDLIAGDISTRKKS